METIDEGLVFRGCTEAAAEIEYGIVIIQGQGSQQDIQFPEAIPDIWWIRFMRFLIGSEQLIQHGLTIWIAGVKVMVICAVFQQFQK